MPIFKMNARTSGAPFWFAIAIAPMVASQFVRLEQADPAAWLLWDYAGRLGTLAVLAVAPFLRAVAYRPEPCRIALWEVALWIAGVFVAARILYGFALPAINEVLPSTALGAYPRPTGWLYYFDLVFGLALVAYNEEVVFRRCAAQAFTGWLGNGYRLVIGTSLLFGAYHWWSGAANVVIATVVGILLMLFLRRSIALWPVVLCHYLIDVVGFS